MFREKVLVAFADVVERFGNSPHLNKRGVEIFSKQLAKDIKELGLINQGLMELKIKNNYAF